MSKKVLFAALMLGFTLAGMARSSQEEVCLKDGSALNGTSMDMVSNEPVKMQAQEDNILVYKDISKITKEVNGLSQDEDDDEPAGVAKRGYKGFVGFGAQYWNVKQSSASDSANPPLTNVLTDSISQIVSACPGEIGVAVIVNNRDTVKVNNKSVYPMMSVFKVHQALALCNDFDNKGISLDTLVNINRDKLDPKTWSPMLKDYSGPVISLTVRDLLRYTLTQSDNNASNLMFKDMVNVAQTDSFIATLIPRSSFQIAYTEEEMSADHNKAYSNYTSPLGAAMLMNRLFTEGLIDDEKQSFIKNTLKECKTGVDRIAAPLLDKEGVVIAHKTGSGDVNENGVLAAHNDVAYICLPNNISYTLAVFVKDFKGNESQASQYVAHISAVVYSLLMQTSVKS